MKVPETPARHLPTPVQRWTAAVKSPPSWVNAKPPSAGMGCAATRRRLASSGSTPGCSSSAPSAGARPVPPAAPDTSGDGEESMAAPSLGWSASSAGARPGRVACASS